ncbi:hypothetical protein KR054_004967, partial [Drosophila jambulina]
SDDKNVLLEEDCYKIIQVDFAPENNEENGNDFEILPEQEDRPYRFLQNCNSVALWMCVIYNLCMVLLLVFVFVYKKLN